MPVKFLELDSNYRNRNLYENPAEFTVNVSQSGNRSNIDAFDPVTYAYPQIVFIIDDFSGVSFTVSVPLSDNILDSASSLKKFVVTGTAVKNIQGYYVGAILLISTTSPIQATRIIEFTPMDNGTNFLITTETPINDAGIFTVYNPSVITSPPNIEYPYVFIPTSLSISNYYNKYIMYNQTRGNYAKIIGFDKDTHLAKLSNITGLNWVTSDVLVVRKTPPSSTGSVGSATANTITFPFLLDSSYINSFVRTYTTTTSTDYQLVKIINLDPVYDNSDPPKKTLSSDTVTISPQPGVPFIPADCVFFEILPFNIDNASPFVYNGTMSSQSQPVSNEITLNSLTLPNVSLSSGGRIAYYPYVYVEIDNASSTSSVTKNTIYSNNPHTYKAVFKVPITDLNHPLQSPFVKLTGNGMKQTIVFKQNDDVKITIRLPNGDVFTTLQADNVFGNLPNPFLQISAVFGIEKV